jgi:glyoxylase-like metal-dependent hydrolase (beta-lactamase superfamily II)
MHRERISENVYWFQSEVYAQVTAGVIVGPQWAVLVDTLALPEESLAIRDFVEKELETEIRYIINTHYHADHTWGNCFFPNAMIVAHAKCRQLLEERGIPAMEEARKQNQIFRQSRIVLPHITFEEGEITLRVGKKNLTIMPAPGHSPDGIMVLVDEDRILFAGDAFMPIPFIVDGDLEEITSSIKKISRLGLENIVQGHGDVILRGEIDAAVKENITYLTNIRKVAKAATRRRAALEFLQENGIESCGKSRVYLGGLAEELHRRNLRALYLREKEAVEEDSPEK